MTNREKILGLALIAVVTFAGWETSHGRGHFKANAAEAERLHHNFTEDSDPRPLREEDLHQPLPTGVVFSGDK